MDRYVVMGNPIAHSRSPRIHALFAQQTRQQLSYDKRLVPIDGFAEAVRSFFAEGGKGLNVTVPFKQEAWALVDERSQRAEDAGAVNTILVEADGRLYGDNTDGVGLVRDLHRNGVTLSEQKVLLLGAGGAARGVLPALLQEIPQSVTVANRTAAKAQELAVRLGGRIQVHGCGFDELAGQQFHVVINATSAGLEGAVPPLPEELLGLGAACYDMVYAAEPTPFVRWAQAHGAQQALDGLGMLVEQAAESFALWRGLSPDTAPVIATLREEMLG